jgi:pilus assembly protein CpaE
VILIAGRNPDLEDLFRADGLLPRTSPDLFETGSTLSLPAADVLVVDLRSRLRLPGWMTEWKQQHPATPVVLVLGTPDPDLMLSAMRTGINECLVEPLERADAQAAIARVMGGDRSVPGEVFAFIGAKGGVGTTTVAVNVAAAIARVAGGTLLIDLNTAGGDAALMVGGEPRFSVLDALENTHRADEAFFRGLLTQAACGLPLLASPGLAFGQTVDRGRVRALIEFVRSRYRYTVLDLPRTGAASLEALDAAGTVVIVANQELTTLRGAAALAASLRDADGVEAVGAVLNRYDARAALEKKDVEEIVGVPVIGRFPSWYRQIVEAVNRGEPLGPRTEPGRAFEQFACELARLGAPAQSRMSVVARLASALTGVF